MANLGKKMSPRLLVALLAGFLCGPGCGGDAAPTSGKTEAQDGSRPRNQGTASSSAGLTKAKLDQLHAGMTEQEIKKVLGAPTSAGKLAGGRILIWEEGETKVQVTIQNDKALALVATHLEQEIDKITKENVSRLQPGMTVGQVVDLLGPGKSETWSTGSRTLVWEYGKKQVETTFVDGKLILQEVKGFN
jgi:outer membrane protein assembly factor BamE (lipoprotein component of BamABCDE complex)